MIDDTVIVLLSGGVYPEIIDSEKNVCVSLRFIYFNNIKIR
jgi:hypothetical protein